jgi:DNA-binding transcriptional LysR family regulator
MREYPEVQLDVSLIDRVVDIVEEGYDMAVRIARRFGRECGAQAGHLAQRAVRLARLHPAARHAANPADLLQHACIGYSYAASADEWQMLDASGAAHAVKVRCVMHTNNGDTARSAALGGLGVIWQPTFLVGEDLRAGRLQRVLPDYHMPTWMCWPSTRAAAT